jgi:hypothetical protein
MLREQTHPAAEFPADSVANMEALGTCADRKLLGVLPLCRHDPASSQEGIRASTIPGADPTAKSPLSRDFADTLSAHARADVAAPLGGTARSDRISCASCVG